MLVCKEKPVQQTDLAACVRAIDKCTLKKSKHVRANNSSFLNKKISKAIMDRTRLRNKFLKNLSRENRFAYIQQRSFSISLIRKTKLEYLNNLNQRNVTDNKFS